MLLPLLMFMFTKLDIPFIDFGSKKPPGGKKKEIGVTIKKKKRDRSNNQIEYLCRVATDEKIPVWICLSMIIMFFQAI